MLPQHRNASTLAYASAIVNVGSLADRSVVPSPGHRFAVSRSPPRIFPENWLGWFSAGICTWVHVPLWTLGHVPNVQNDNFLQ